MSVMLKERIFRKQNVPFLAVWSALSTGNAVTFVLEFVLIIFPSLFLKGRDARMDFSLARMIYVSPRNGVVMEITIVETIQMNKDAQHVCTQFLDFFKLEFVLEQFIVMAERQITTKKYIKDI